MITVIVTDNGGTANGGINTVIRTFTVTVTGSTSRPRSTPFPQQPAVFENSGPQTINLTGISAGPGDAEQIVTITATSSNPSLIPNPTITYTSPNTTGTLTFTPVANGTGTATITVTVTDNGGTANGGVNTFSANLHGDGHCRSTSRPRSTRSATRRDPREHHRRPQTVNLAGISAGTGDTGQILTVTATSSNPALITNPTVTYTSPSTDRHAHLSRRCQRQRHGRRSPSP